MDDNSEKLADASVQQQEPASPHSASDDQNCETGQSPPDSPKDVKSTENQDSPHSPHEKIVAADAGITKELENKSDGEDTQLGNQPEFAAPQPVRISPVMKAEDGNGAEMKNEINDTEMEDGDESGTEEDRVGFMKVLETFYRENSLEFKPPKFYGEPLNCLKLWRAVTRLGGYDRVTASKLWRQVGETFHPPKTCTTVSWTFRIFYEKALLEYEKHKRQSGELHFPDLTIPEPMTVESEATGYKTPGSGSGRARRDSAARAMQGWHAQRHYGYGEDKNLNSAAKREKHLKTIGVNSGLIKQKKAANLEHPEKAARSEADKQLAATVVDLGTPADWVKINVRETKDCFEVYALVPGLLREEVRVQSDPAGRLVITGQPEQLDNPWGITPFKKVVNLPARIDPLQTSAVVSLHGRLFVRVPFEQSNFGR